MTALRLYGTLLAISIAVVALVTATQALIVQAIDAALASGAGIWLGAAAVVGVVVLVVIGRRGRRAVDTDFDTEARRAFRRKY